MFTFNSASLQRFPTLPELFTARAQNPGLSLKDSPNKSLFAVRRVKLSCLLCLRDLSEWVDGMRWSKKLQRLPEARGRQDGGLSSKKKKVIRPQRNLYLQMNYDV